MAEHSRWELAAALGCAVAELPRCRVVGADGSYRHAVCTSALLRFRDELELRPAAGEIAVRSASRVGYSDLGVNRRRVEHLRALLRERGVVN